MQKPCKTCPFRTDIKFHLPKERRKDIVEGITNDHVFTCHQGLRLPVGKRTACIGSAIVIEQENGILNNQAYRIHALLGNLRHNDLDMESPVFDTFDDFIEAGD